MTVLAGQTFPLQFIQLAATPAAQGTEQMGEYLQCRAPPGLLA